MSSMLSQRASGIFLVAALAACVTGAPQYGGPMWHRSFFEAPARALPESAVLLPVLCVAGARDEEGRFKPDEELSSTRATELEAALAAERRPFELLPLPALDEAEHATLARHRELFAVVARAALAAGQHGSTPADKLRDFDYTLGPGLACLAPRTGAPVALFVANLDHSLMVGLVELASGDLLWVGPGSIFRWDEDGLRRSLARLFDDYPGLEDFARVRRRS